MLARQFSGSSYEAFLIQLINQMSNNNKFLSPFAFSLPNQYGLYRLCPRSLLLLPPLELPAPRPLSPCGCGELCACIPGCWLRQNYKSTWLLLGVQLMVDKMKLYLQDISNPSVRQKHGHHCHASRSRSPAIDDRLQDFVMPMNQYT